MSGCNLAGLFLISAALAFAQLDSNTVTVTASRTSNPKPDQIAIDVSVDSDFATTLGDVLAVLQGSGIALSDFTGVSTGLSQLPTLQWRFEIASPLTNIKTTLLALTRLQ